MADSENPFACKAANRTFVVNERPALFLNSRTIERSHNLSPRFGHTSEINNLINGSKDDARDYTAGLVAGSIAIGCFFLFWLVTLIGLKCLGYKRVGFFSGHRVKVRKPKPTPYEASGENVGEEDVEQAEQYVDSPIVDPQNDEEEQPEKDTESGTAETSGETIGDPEGTSVQKKEESLKPDISTTNPQKDLVEERETDQREDDTGGAVTAVAETEEGEEVIFHRDAESMEESEGSLKETPEEEHDMLQQQQQQRDLQQEYEEEVAKVERRLKRIRIVVLGCGLGIAICVILMCLLGIEYIVDSLDSGRSGLNKAEDLAQGGIDLIDAYIERQDAAAVNVNKLREDVNSFCPGLREEICSNVTSGTSTTCDLSDVPDGDEIFVFLNDTQSYLYGELGDLRHDLEEIAQIFQDADDASEEFYWAFYIALAFAVPLGVLDLTICYIVVLAWNKKLSQGSYCYRKIRGCFLNGFVVPLFIFLVLMSWIFSMVFVIGSTAAADTCIDSPDSRLSAFLIEREEKFDSVVYEFALWILKGCNEDLVPMEIQDQAKSILSFFTRIVDLTVSFADENPEEFQELCGTNLTVIESFAKALSAQICVLSSTMFDIQDFFSCQNWHPLYRVIMYDAVCFEGTEGLTWLAITQFVVVFLAMIMLTLRVAFYESLTEEEEAELEESRRAFWASFRERMATIFCCRCGEADDTGVQAEASNSEVFIQDDDGSE